MEKIQAVETNNNYMVRQFLVKFDPVMFNFLLF